MLFNFGFHSSILLIFFVHGLLFSGLLYWKSVTRGDKAGGWLAFFTLLCTLNISPWMLGHAGWYFHQPYRNILFYFPCQNFLLLGPTIFFYTKQLLNPGFRLTKNSVLHFVPGLIYILYSVFMFVADEFVLQHPYFYADGHDRDLDNWYRVLGIISLTCYLVLSLRYYGIYKKVTAQLLSFADTMLFRWIRRYLAALLLMQGFDLLFLYLYPGWGSFPAKWWYYFFFSILFYYVAFMGYTQSIRPIFSFRPSHNRDKVILLQSSGTPTNHQPVFLLDTGEEQLIETGTIDESASEMLEDDLQPLKLRVLQAMKDEQMFREPELTLTVVARRLQTNASILSKVVNKGLGLSFNDLVNSYRVEAVKRELRSGAHKQQTLLGVALDCGFNSKTTFNRVFKKHTGLAPKTFIEQLAGDPVEPLLNQDEYESPNHDLERPASTDLPNSSQILNT